MIESTLAEIRSSATMQSADDVVHIYDARKKREVGYFIPSSLKEEFESFLQRHEQKRKKALLERVASAQAKDPIEEGGVGDAIE
jgi:predicted DNA-binding protein (UPF0278 family)